MQRDSIIGPPISQPLCQRYGALIWSLLDAGLHKSALFYAERYFVEDVQNHDARHLYATVLIEAGQPHSAHRLVNVPAKGAGCTGCLHVLAQCCMKLGRHRQAREALEGCLRDNSFVPTRAYFIVAPPARRTSYVRAGSMGQRTANAFPDAATLCCQAGNSALKGNLHESAAMSYRQALALNPMIWEAFEGLCAIGAFALMSRDGQACKPPPEKCAGNVCIEPQRSSVPRKLYFSCAFSGSRPAPLPAVRMVDTHTNCDNRRYPSCRQPLPSATGAGIAEVWGGGPQ